MSRQMMVALNLLTSYEDPQAAIEGDVYFNVVTKNLRIYNGTVWVELTPPSDDPTPFYMHTHNYDGDVHTIDIQNKITFDAINVESGPQINFPQIVGVEGGTPLSNNDGTWQELTAFDGGEYNSIFEPDTNDTLVDGGSSVDEEGSEILDLGGSN
jgi:hypothetical protein